VVLLSSLCLSIVLLNTVFKFRMATVSKDGTWRFWDTNGMKFYFFSVT